MPNSQWLADRTKSLTDSFTDWHSVSFTNPVQQGWSAVQVCKHTSHSKHLKTGCLWWQHCAPTDSANLQRWHCAGHIQIFTIFSPWLHQHHAIAAAHVLGWILRHHNNMYETWTISHAARNLSPFMKPESSSQCSQESTSHLFHEIDKFSLHPCTYFFKINFNITLPFTSRSSGILTKFCIYFSFLPHPLILLDLIIIISDKQYKLWHSSVCNFLHPPAVFFLSGQNTYLSTLNIQLTPHLMYLNLKVFTYLTFNFSDPKSISGKFPLFKFPTNSLFEFSALKEKR
jgi:hypothetical protein